MVKFSNKNVQAPLHYAHEWIKVKIQLTNAHHRINKNSQANLTFRISTTIKWNSPDRFKIPLLVVLLIFISLQVSDTQVVEK